jgi:LPPG:FO 2-phospho-L-lactate transferase
LATHVERTRRLAAGETLSAVTADFCARLGVRAKIVPMTDQPVRTMVQTDDGWLPFQDYFVRLRCAPAVRGFRFDGVARAVPSAGFLQALADPELAAIVICPSNPFVSVDPILSLAGARELLARRRAPLVAVSPIVGGKAIKGPALKMLQELGFVIDRQDAALTPSVEALGLNVLAADTIMADPAAQARLAEVVLGFAQQLRRS